MGDADPCRAALAELDERPRVRAGVLRCRVCHSRTIYAGSVAEFRTAHCDGRDDRNGVPNATADEAGGERS